MSSLLVGHLPFSTTYPGGLALLRGLAVAGALLLSLAPRAQGVLHISTAPSGAAVRIDGELAGEAPLTVDVAAGAHRVEASARGFRRATLEVVAVDGDTTAAHLVLGREMGALSVAGLPPEARVEINGRDLGSQAALAAGFASLRVVVPGTPAVSTVVEIVPDAETEVTYQEPSFRAPYVLYAALFPGGVQILDGRPAMGALLVGSLFVAGVGVATTQQQASRADAERLAALVAYDRALSEADAVAAREQATGAAERGRRALRFRGAFIGAAVLVELVAILDGTLHHARRPSLGVSRPALALRADGVSLRLGL